MGVQPGGGERVAFGWQAIDAKPRLHPLERQFDLPAQSIERPQTLDGKSLAWQGGDQNQVIGGFKRERMGAMSLVFAARSLRAGPGAGRDVGGFWIRTRRMGRGAMAPAPYGR